MNRHLTSGALFLVTGALFLFLGVGVPRRPIWISIGVILIGLGLARLLRARRL